MVEQFPHGAGHQEYNDDDAERNQSSGALSVADPSGHFGCLPLLQLAIVVLRRGALRPYLPSHFAWRESGIRYAVRDSITPVVERRIAPLHPVIPNPQLVPSSRPHPNPTASTAALPSSLSSPPLAGVLPVIAQLHHPEKRVFRQSAFDTPGVRYLWLYTGICKNRRNMPIGATGIGTGDVRVSVHGDLHSGFQKEASGRM